MKRFLLIGFSLILALALVVGCTSVGGSRQGQLPAEVDIVIIGGGGAGFTAAVTARQLGSSVVVLEKMPYTGGNTALAGSAANAPHPAWQLNYDMAPSEITDVEAILAMTPRTTPPANGVWDNTLQYPAGNAHMTKWLGELRAAWTAHRAGPNSGKLFDHPALHKIQTYYGGDYRAKPELVDIFGDNALDALMWLHNDMGGKWRVNHIDGSFGATWRRAHLPDFEWGSRGANFVFPQEAKFESLNNGQGAFLLYRADKIIMENGRAVGVEGTINGGPERFSIRARKGVILATGGYGTKSDNENNFENMILRYQTQWNPEDLRAIISSNGPMSTGDGIKMAIASDVNARILNMDVLQLVAGGLQYNAAISNLMYINRRGERYVREDARRDILAGAALAQPNRMYWTISNGHTIVDEMNWVSYTGQNIVDIIDSSPDNFMVGYKGPNAANSEYVELNDAELEPMIRELARVAGFDPDTLWATIRAYNAAVDGSQADPLGRGVFDKKMNKPPFTAGPSTPFIHHTMGGVEVDTDLRVINERGAVIPGLYAAGEVTGNLHGSNRLGANAITDTLVFGRIAGQSAATGR